MARRRLDSRYVALAVSTAIGVAVAAVFWWGGLMDAASVATLQDRLAGARSGPAVSIAVVIAFAVGASMVVLPCGFPAVFAIPSTLERAESTGGRLRMLAAFAAGAIVPLVIAGAALGLVGDGARVAFDNPEARQLLATIVFSLAGLAAFAYALSEFELLGLQGAFARVVPPMPGPVSSPRRAMALGATFGGGMGIACPMPTYYALLGWVTVTASPWYGAVVLAAYAAGRIVVPVVLGLMIAGGLSRRTVSARLVAAHHRLQHGSGMLMAALGAFLLTLFGGFAGTDLL